MHIVTLIFALISMFTGTFDASQINMPFYMVVPFNTLSKLGWLLFWFIQFNMCFSYAICMVSMTSYFVGCCVYMDSICRHFELLIHLADENIQLNQKEKNSIKINETDQKVQELLAQAIEMHYKLVELV